MLYVISRCLQCYSDKCFKKFSCWEERGVTIGIRASRSVRAIRRVLLSLSNICITNLMLLLLRVVEYQLWLEGTMLH